MTFTSHCLDIVSSVNEIRDKVLSAKKKNKKIAFVPTMGGLHKGHLSLIRKSKLVGDVSIVSIFVNPMQFGPAEDYSVYPREEEKDIKLLEDNGVNILYFPDKDSIYPKNFQTEVSVKKIENTLCGKFRPSHFKGVATIVTKLLIQVMPDYAIFGEKDYQQLVLINQLVSDLNIPVKVISCPTIREDDGLAFSSRNTFLSEDGRYIASNLYSELLNVGDLVRRGGNISNICEKAVQNLLDIGFSSVDYIEVCDAISLKKLDKIEDNSRVFGAAYIGNTRIIDNIII